MGGWINYKGRDIAHYHFKFTRKSRDDSAQVTRYNFRFESLEFLTEVLNAEPRETINIEGKDMCVAQFRKDFLSQAHRIYINPDCELFDMMENNP